ncbi:MAG: HD domain-containing phosphohydrolase, partial [Endomicrobiia bacterium]
YYDGSGFTQGLKEQNIPFGARIIGFAEFIEDLKLKGHSQENIKKIVEEEAGKKLDPKIVEIYLSEIAPSMQEVSSLT